MELEVGDIVVYEPGPEWREAQEMYGSMGVVRELLPDEPFGLTRYNCVRIRWIHQASEHWHEMKITEGNCRKVGHIEPGEAPDERGR